MDHQERELRRAAAQAFADSLNKLEQTLCSPEDEPIFPSCSIDLEQAVAEIEQFIQAQETVLPQVEPSEKTKLPPN